MGKSIHNFYEFFISLTGLESEQVRDELDRYVAKLGLNSSHLTESDIRLVMIEYLKDLKLQSTLDDEDEILSPDMLISPAKA